MKKIFIATSSFSKNSSKPFEMLKNKKIKFTINSAGRKLSESETIKALIDCEGVIAGTEIYSKNVLNSLPKLKLISRLGIGIDNIDMKEIDNLKIKLYKTETSPAIAVAELSLGLILNLLRRINRSDAKLKQSNWEKMMGFILTGKTLGIIGLGTIGKELIKISKGFNLNYLAYDQHEDVEFAKKHNVTYTSLSELLSSSDVISIHLSLNTHSHKIINKNNINLLKQNTILINTSRGEIIDESALYKALKSKSFFGAGLDVFSKEPYLGELLSLENVILTPHIGSYAKEIRNQMEIESVKNIIRGFDEI